MPEAEIHSVYKCEKCDHFRMADIPCLYCNEADGKQVFSICGLKEIIRDMFTIQGLQFFAFSSLNGIFMHHFNYSVVEIVAQAVCVAIVMPAFIKRAQ